MMMGQHWLTGDEQFYAAINVETLLIHGRQDRLVSPTDTQLMHEVLHAAIILGLFGNHGGCFASW